MQDSDLVHKKPTDNHPSTSPSTTKNSKPSCSCGRCGHIINACQLENLAGSRDPLYAQPQYEMNLYRLVSRLYDIESGEEKWESRRWTEDKIFKYWEERAETEPELSLPTWALDDPVIRQLHGWQPHRETCWEAIKRHQREYRERQEAKGRFHGELTPISMSTFTSCGSNGWTTPPYLKPEVMHGPKSLGRSDPVRLTSPESSLHCSLVPPTGDAVSTPSESFSPCEEHHLAEGQNHENSNSLPTDNYGRPLKRTFMELSSSGKGIVVTSPSGRKPLELKHVPIPANDIPKVNQKRKRWLLNDLAGTPSLSLVDLINTPTLRPVKRVRYKT